MIYQLYYRKVLYFFGGRYFQALSMYIYQVSISPSDYTVFYVLLYNITIELSRYCSNNYQNTWNNNVKRATKFQFRATIVYVFWRVMSVQSPVHAFKGRYCIYLPDDCRLNTMIVTHKACHGITITSAVSGSLYCEVMINTASNKFHNQAFLRHDNMLRFLRNT